MPSANMGSQPCWAVVGVAWSDGRVKKNQFNPTEALNSYFSGKLYEKICDSRFKWIKFKR